jgi:hypothetical protein
MQKGPRTIDNELSDQPGAGICSGLTKRTRRIKGFRLTFAFCLTCGCFMFLPGCKKDVFYNYAFNLNGVAENGYNYAASYHRDTAAGLFEFAAEFYVGAMANNNYVQISFAGPNHIPPGIYYTGVPYNGNTCSFAYNNDTINYQAISGTLQIKSIDTVQRKMAGIFAFTAVSNLNYHDTASITTGAFANIVYTTQ